MGTKWCDTVIKSLARNMSLSPINVFYDICCYVTHLNPIFISFFSPTSVRKLSHTRTNKHTYTHTACNRAHLQGTSHKTCQEEQMSLSTERIITLTALQTVLSARLWKANGRRLFCEDVSCNVCACASMYTYMHLHCAVIIFGKLTRICISVTLHALESTSSVAITTGGSGREQERSG